MRASMKRNHDDTILSLLLTCKTTTHLKRLHGLMITSSLTKSTIHVSKVIDFCVDANTDELLRYARSVFGQISRPSLYIWNSIIRGYSNSHDPLQALIAYRQMQRKSFSPDHFTFPFALKACSAIADVTFGRSVHVRVAKSGFGAGVHTSTALLHMYACCGDMEDARKVFDEIPKWSVVAWASLISGLVNNDRASEAVEAFKDMVGLEVEPNEIVTVNVLVACARTGDVETGKFVHRLINGLGGDPFSSAGGDFNIILASAIIDMYAKCGSLGTAKDLFDKMPRRNSVAWNSMIGAYNKYGRASESLELFHGMRVSGLLPDQATFVVVLGACASLGALSLGQCVHACVEKTKLSNDLTVGTTLVYMYAKTGDLASARRVFDSLRNKDVEAWTTMILGLAKHGHGNEALSAFESMRQNSIVPDRITYIGVLSACGHVGLVDQGLRHFDEMWTVYGIVPEQEHYSCAVDLLSRAGKFKDAVRFVDEMPFEPNVIVWGALLIGCEIHENVDLANKVRKRINELESNSSGVYVLLSNIYAKAGNWQAVNLARDLMKQRNLRKTLGHSLVQKIPG